MLLPTKSVLDRTSNDRAGDRSHGVTRGKKNPLYQALSRRVALLRGTAALPQHELAELAHITRQGVSLIESGQRTAKISTVEFIATALGVSPAYLAFGEDGEKLWRKRIPRFGLEPEQPPVPNPAARPCPNLHLGMGERLARGRKAKGLSMRALGRAAGCTVASISLLESGTGIVLLSTCEELAKALDVAPGWLAYGLGAGPVED